jgi:hypothetical protein
MPSGATIRRDGCGPCPRCKKAPDSDSTHASSVVHKGMNIMPPHAHTLVSPFLIPRRTLFLLRAPWRATLLVLSLFVDSSTLCKQTRENFTSYSKHIYHARRRLLLHHYSTTPSSSHHVAASITATQPRSQQQQQQRRRQFGCRRAMVAVAMVRPRRLRLCGGSLVGIWTGASIALGRCRLLYRQ